MATITSPRAASPASITPRIKSPSIAETQTPTSSTRGSFEIPHRNPSVTSTSNSTTNTNTNANALPPPHRRANRAALRDYYNLKSKPHPQPQHPGPLSRTASITSTTSTQSTTTLTDPTLNNANPPPTTTTTLLTALDTPTFTPTTYLTTLLTTTHLHEILRIEATLVSEIRNLDGERKALVYDNYSKLIAAVGTIGEMQRSMNVKGGGLSDVGELEGRMERLRGMARGLAGGNGEGIPEAEVDRDMQGRKEQRKQRGDRTRMERNRVVVKRVLAAPERLRALLDQANDEEAEKEWSYVRTRLDTWEGVKGAAEVRAQCEAIMRTSSSSSDDDDDGEANTKEQ